MNPPKIGTIGWVDLTVDDAPRVRDFYSAVVGWTPQSVSMGTYEDYGMNSGPTSVAGICHARGVNANIPPAWLIYVVVADLAASLAACQAHGGDVIDGPRSMGGGQMAIIRDPAGAVCALWETAG
jgi:uncharacterized protein